MTKITKRHKCPYPGCKHVTAYKNNLQVHIRRKHTGERPFKCDYPNCDYTAVTKAELMRHIRCKHTGEKPFKCKDHPKGDPKCEYAAVDQSDLNTHICRHHTGEKPYQCHYPECDFAAASSCQLTDHIRRHHTGEKPFKCSYPECDFATASSSELTQHVRRHHTGEKPFKCSYPKCDYAAASSSQLMRHIRFKHTGEKPYECPHCDFATAQASGLTRHLHSNACEYSHREAFLWQKLCRKTRGFLRPDCKELPSTIMTPNIEGKNYIVPDDPLRHPDGTIEFIEAKRTPDAISEKNTAIYSMKADKVTFWCLFGDPRRFEDKPSLSIEISDQLIHQLEAQKTSANEEAIGLLILQITLLQLGIDFKKQRSLMPFFEDAEEDS